MAGCCPACGGDRHGSSYVGRAYWEDFRYEYRTCSSCGTLFAEPMPPPEVLARLYAPSYLEAHYAGQLLGEEGLPELDRELGAACAAMAARHPGGTLLDIGCGAGKLLRAAREAGLRVEGYEPVAESAARTRAALGEVRIHSGALSTLDGRYDLVHLADVLEHAPSPLAILSDAQRLLAPNGTLLARGPLEAQPHLFLLTVQLSRRLRSIAGPLPPLPLPPAHIIQFTLAGWHALLARAGLSILEEQVTEINWPVAQGGARGLIRKASIRLSRSPVGRALRSANRVMSLLEPLRKMQPASRSDVRVA